MRPVRRFSGECGSMPFALIGIILVAGLSAALFTVTIATQKSVRSDRQFHRSLTGSDAGVQQALTYISELESDSAGPLGGTAEVAGVTFDWTADRNGNRWEITSTGLAGDQSRTVEATIERHGTFLVGAFADLAFTMRGANGADSYNSATGDTGTGEGSVGTNGEMTMNGNAFADRILLYGDATCTGEGCENGEISGRDTRFDIDAIEASIDRMIDDICGGTFESYRASAYGPLVAGETYCFSSMRVDQNTILENASDGTVPSLQNPVTVLLAGSFDMNNHTHMNCASCGSSTDTPDSGSLQIYGTGPELTLGVQTKIAAAIAMPAAACQGSPSNAQADIYGSMLCDDLDNQGGWNFHYDQNLENVDTGFWSIAEWREEMVGETSF